MRYQYRATASRNAITVSGLCDKKINYNSCIDKHKNDENFYRGEWRVYLSRDTELWKSKREVIKLIDEKGKDIGTITY